MTNSGGTEVVPVTAKEVVIVTAEVKTMTVVVTEGEWRGVQPGGRDRRERVVARLEIEHREGGRVMTGAKVQFGDMTMMLPCGPSYDLGSVKVFAAVLAAALDKMEGAIGEVEEGV
jgi:hypothetical protein